MQQIIKGYVDITDGQLHYRLRPGHGAPVVFLHQTASSGAMWERVIAALPEGRPLYALDTPGFGSSFDPPAGPSLDDYARWIGEAIASLGLVRPHVVGHHTGASIAAALNMQQPGLCRSLALIGPGYADAAERAAMAQRFGKPFRPVRSGAYLLKNWEYLRVGGADADIALLHREMVDQMRAHATRSDAYAAVWQADSIAAFMAIHCPALIMAARDDVMFPSFARAGAARPDIAAVELSGGANFEPDIVPGEVAAALAAHFDRAEGQTVDA